MRFEIIFALQMDLGVGAFVLANSLVFVIILSVCFGVQKFRGWFCNLHSNKKIELNVIEAYMVAN